MEHSEILEKNTANEEHLKQTRAQAIAELQKLSNKILNCFRNNNLKQNLCQNIKLSAKPENELSCLYIIYIFKNMGSQHKGCGHLKNFMTYYIILIF